MSNSSTNVPTFTRPTVQELYNTIIADYSSRTGQTVPLFKRAVVKSFAYALAGVISLLWNFATWQYLQIFLVTCELEALERWGNLVGIKYRQGSKAILQLTLTNVQLGTIQAGTVWKSLSNGLVYTSLPSKVVTGSTVTLNVECTTSGSIGNLLNDEVLHLTNPIIGLPETAMVTDTLSLGTEDEELENYRTRVLQRYQRQPQGGSAIDYYNWATEVNGIVDCLPYVLNNGVVTLYLIANGSGLNRTPSGELSPTQFPQWQQGQMLELDGSGQFLAVAKAINGSGEGNNDRRPLNTPVELKAPVYTQYKIEINGLSPFNDELNHSIKQALITELDHKKPHLKALGYTVNQATINSNQLSAIVQNLISSVDGAFTSFSLKNSNNETILTDVLGVGCLAYLGELKINNSSINL